MLLDWSLAVWTLCRRWTRTGVEDQLKAI